MHRAGITSLLSLVLLLATSCSQSPSLSSPERDPSAYSAFPNTGSVSSHSAESNAGDALEVVMKRPEGEVTGSSVVTVSFNQPMVDANIGGAVADEPPFRLEPQVAGTYRWMGSRTAVFHPKEALPNATHFRVTVPAGTESLEGATLADEHSFDFRTPYLNVTRVRTTPDSHKLRPESKILVYMNLEVDADAAGVLDL